MDEKYDQAFLGILQNEGKIEPFLDAVLGFLYRRTDFYRILKSREDKLGFPPGVAQGMLASTFRKYEELAAKDEKERKKMSEQKQTKKQETVKDKVKSASTETKTSPKQTVGVSNQGDVMTSDPAVTLPASRNKPEGSSLEPEVKQTKQVDPKTGEEDDDPELTRQQEEFQSRFESYNGAVRENYTWSQSITDLDLRVNVPSHIRKGRDVQVEIEKKRVCVRHVGESGGWVEVINGELTWEIQKEESIWSLVPGDHVHINFEKKDERWWEAVLVNEPKISVRKIDASRPMTDLDQEAQAKIEEMMYNDRQKKLGKPQSHEQKVHDMLRNAWDAEGSPFKGQEFDPSKFKVDQSGVVSMNPS